MHCGEELWQAKGIEKKSKSFFKIIDSGGHSQNATDTTVCTNPPPIHTHTNLLTVLY